jgi:hypothetical protein
MVRRPVSVILSMVAVSLFLEGPASAQSPWPAYGARRGHIRIVQGPFRTVYRIHWGNGLSPEGAAVLLAGIEAAENYFAGSAGEEDGSRELAPKDRSPVQNSRSPVQRSVEKNRGPVQKGDDEGGAVDNRKHRINELLAACDSLLNQLDATSRLASATDAAR